VAVQVAPSWNPVIVKMAGEPSAAPIGVFAITPLSQLRAVLTFAELLSEKSL
jgi:hypothetical protein